MMQLRTIALQAAADAAAARAEENVSAPRGAAECSSILPELAARAGVSLGAFAPSESSSAQLPSRRDDPSPS